MASPSKRGAAKTWHVEISRTAERQITKLDRKAQQAILRFLRERVAGAEDPRLVGKALQGDRKGLWRYRVGDYRLICDIQDERVVVVVLEAAHRKEIYR